MELEGAATTLCRPANSALGPWLSLVPGRLGSGRPLCPDALNVAEEVGRELVPCFIVASTEITLPYKVSHGEGREEA